MITIDLEKSLVRNKRKLLTNEEIMVLDKMEKIENNKEIEELRSKLGIWSDNAKTASNAKSKILIYNKYPADRIYSESDIRSLCLKYGLRFLPSHYFNGELDTELPGKIKQFEQKYHHGCSGVTKYNSFIAAPAESFKLQKRPKDPLFFVEVERVGYISEQNEKHYFLLHKWGNDISITRWIANLPMRTTALANGLLLSLGFLLGMFTSIFYNNQPVGLSLMFGLLGTVLMLLVIMLVGIFLDMISDDSRMDIFVTGNDEKWNSPYIN